jgi:hypothetical protein
MGARAKKPLLEYESLMDLWSVLFLDGRKLKEFNFPALE